jgi:transposase
MYSFLVGSDMSKEFFDVSFHNGSKAIYLSQFENNHKGFKKLLACLKKQTDHPISSWFICFENTGVYSKAFLEWLMSQGIPCREENALKISKSLGLRRGKSDKIDSRDICIYAFEKRDSIEPSSLPKPLIVRLKKLLSRRDLLVKQKVALRVSLSEQKGILDPDLFEELDQANQELIGIYEKQIRQIEELIDNCINDDEQAKLNHELAQSVIGIGPINSAFILAFTENYSCFSNARKFACYSGTAPFPNQSGKTKGRDRVSHMANKRIKSLLTSAVLTAIKYDPQLNIYYNKKRAEGKEYGVVANAVKNKLIQRVFCVINRQSPYVKLQAYA